MTDVRATELPPRYTEAQVRDAISRAWTHSGRMFRIAPGVDSGQIVEVSPHEFASLVITYAGQSLRREINDA